LPNEALRILARQPPDNPLNSGRIALALRPEEACNMAYLSFTEFAPAAAAGTDPLTPRSPEPDSVPARFSALEWTVVAIAERDPLSSLKAPGRMAIALGALFPERPNPKLADPKLEALRRLAVLSWHHGYRVAESAVRAFLAAGFTLHQYALLAGSIASARAKRVRSTSR
jgi:hypothetical protein